MLTTQQALAMKLSHPPLQEVASEAVDSGKKPKKLKKPKKDKDAKHGHAHPK